MRLCRLRLNKDVLKEMFSNATLWSALRHLLCLCLHLRLGLCLLIYMTRSLWMRLSAV